MSETEQMLEQPHFEPVTSLGKLLQTARVEKGLSLEEVSAFLRFSVGQLSSLESDQYDVFSNRVYLQGIARNYGKFLEVDSATFDAALKQALPADTAPAIALPYTQEKFEPSGIRLPFVKPLLLVLVLAAVIAGGIYLGKDKLKALSTRSSSTASTVVVDATTVGEVTASEEPVASGIAVAVPDVRPASTTSLTPTDLVVGGKLTISTTESAWIEVRGGKGNKLFSQIVSPGMPVEVPASKPLQLKIGKASHVTLMFNGQPIDLKTYMKGEVAKFTLE